MDGTSRKKDTTKPKSPSKKPGQTIPKDTRGAPEPSKVDQRLSGNREQRLNGSSSSSGNRRSRASSLPATCRRCGSVLVRNTCAACAKRLANHNLPKGSRVPPNPFLGVRLAPKRNYGFPNSASSGSLWQPIIQNEDNFWEGAMAGGQIQSLLDAALDEKQRSIGESLQDTVKLERRSPPSMQEEASRLIGLTSNAESPRELGSEIFESPPFLPEETSLHTGLKFLEAAIARENPGEIDTEIVGSPEFLLQEISELTESPTTFPLLESLNEDEIVENDILRNYSANTIRKQFWRHHQDLKLYKSTLAEATNWIQEMKEALYNADRLGKIKESETLFNDICKGILGMQLAQVASFQAAAEKAVHLRKSIFPGIRTNHELLYSLAQKRKQYLKSRIPDLRLACEDSWVQLCALEAEASNLQGTLPDVNASVRATSLNEKGQSKINLDSGRSLLRAFAAVIKPHKSKIFDNKSRDDLSPTELVALRFLAVADKIDMRDFQRNRQPVEEPGAEPPPKSA